MNRDDMIDDWHDLDRQIKALEKRRESLGLLLMADSPTGSVLESKTGNKLRVCARSVLNPDALQGLVSPSLWTSITKRVPVADLVKAAKCRGKLSDDVYRAACSESKHWLEVR